MKTMIAGVLLATAFAKGAGAETYVVRPGNRVPDSADPDVLLGRGDVGERFCDPLSCVVRTANGSQVLRLRRLATEGTIHLTWIEDASTVYLGIAAYDFASETYTPQFPGQDEMCPAPNVVAVIHFKSYGEQAWLRTLSKLGFITMVPLRQMSWLVWGPREALQSALALPFVDGVLELPAGLKRSGVDKLESADDGGPAPSSVAVVDLDLANSPAKAAIVAIRGFLPTENYRVSGIVSYSLLLDAEAARAFSRLGDVVRVSRGGVPGEPSN